MLHNLKIICYDLQSEKQTRDALHNMTWDTAARGPSLAVRQPGAVRDKSPRLEGVAATTLLFLSLKSHTTGSFIHQECLQFPARCQSN